MKTKMGKSILAVVLVIVLALSAAPGPALAGQGSDFAVLGGVRDTDYSYTAAGVLTFLKSGTYTVSMASAGTTTTTDTIVVKSGVDANITLSGVSIDALGASLCAFDMTGATVSLTLTGANTLTSGGFNAGLQAPLGSSLTIDQIEHGTGSLTATGGKNAAGIGGGSGSDGGTVTIKGGTVTAAAAILPDFVGGAGIGGGGAGGSGGTVSISGGTVIATGCEYGAGIGGGGNGDGGMVSISGGTVTAIGGDLGSGIGLGLYGYGGTVTISGGQVTAEGGATAGIGGMTVTISGGMVTATGRAASVGGSAAGIGGLSYATYGTVNIDGGTVTATGANGAAGIGSEVGHSGVNVTITGGTVTAIGGCYDVDTSLRRGGGAGIGGAANSSGGKVTIRGGTVTATGADGAAGIGGGSSLIRALGGNLDVWLGGNGGEVTIEGGTVTATGGAVLEGTTVLGSYSEGGGAGIGGGSKGSGATVTLSGGSVFAACDESGGAQDIGRGGGDNASAAPGTIDISGTAALFLKHNSGPVPTSATHTHVGPFNDTSAGDYGIPLPAAWSGTDSIGAYLHLITLTYGAGAGKDAPAERKQHIGTTGSVAAPGTMSRAGYAFAGWNTADGDEPSIAVGAPFTFDADTTLYAQWTANGYTLALDPQDGEISPTSSAVTYDAAVGILPTPTRSGYRFGGWYTQPSGQGTRYTAATVYQTAGDTTLYARWILRGDDAPPPPEQKYDADVMGGGSSTGSLPVTVDADSGRASIDMGAQGGGLTDGKALTITVPSIPGVSTYALSIPVAYLSTPDGTGTLTFTTSTGSMALPADMLAGIAGAGGKKAEITIGLGDKSGLPASVKAAVGDHPLVQISLTLDGQPTEWNNPDAPVTISIPYAPTATELASPESIVIWYIDGSGNTVCVPNGHYDPATGTVTFSATHFSDYAVAYNKVSFADVATDAWYSRAVGFIAARGITTGTGNGNYGPEARLTRGQFIVMLMKAYGIEPDTGLANNFADAGNTYYTGYIAAAKRLGISTGVGNNMFAPDREITRQEMFTLLYNALKAIGRLPEGDSGKSLSAFSDAGEIASWAKDAMMLFAATRTIGGVAGKLTPTSTTTRAEMAQVLYSLLAR